MKINFPPFYTALTIAVIILSFIQFSLTAPVKPETDRLAYLHYHIIYIHVRGDEKLFAGSEASFNIYKNGEKVTGIGGHKDIILEYNRQKGIWEGQFPVPWAAPQGVYRIKYAGTEDINSWTGSFTIHSRRPLNGFEKPLKIMTLETTRPLRGFNVPLPGSHEGAGYRGIFEWIRYIGGNTLWYIAAQTASYTEGDLSYERPWLYDNLRTLEEFSAAAKDSGLDFGAWIVAFRAFGVFALRPEWYDYSYAYRRHSGEIYETNGISILDSRRVRDIINMASYLNSLETVDYIGLDYIRPAPAVAGLELVDDFVKAMRIEVPENWSSFIREERMKWLAEIVSAPGSRNHPVKQKWNWYRARRMAMIIKRIKSEAVKDKPLWVFMLSWDKGHEHGQDAVMFQDAGADIVAVMMYEADRRRFNDFVRGWKDYLAGTRVNLVVGNQVDWPVHQHTVYPSGPQEFGVRLEKGIGELASPVNLKGAFINDFSRILSGRRGPYEKNEWLAASGRAFSLFNDPASLHLSISSDSEIIDGEGFIVTLTVRNISGKSIENIRIENINTSGVDISPSLEKISYLTAGSEIEISFSGIVSGYPSFRKGNYMIAFRAGYEDEIYIEYNYFPVSNIPLDIGAKLR